MREPKSLVFVIVLLLIAWSSATAQLRDMDDGSEGEEYSVSVPLPDRMCQGVAATGQTISDEPGDDGWYQMGLTTGAHPRFTDNGDGTVTDNLTGLIWLQHANCFGLRNWYESLSDADSLAEPACGLTDGSLPGDWRLPNVRELFSLVDYGEWYPSIPEGHPFSNVWLSDPYWSSTTAGLGGPPGGNPNFARDVNLAYGFVYSAGKVNILHRAWPVRGGQ
jgi:hypothetical protein